MGAPRVDLMGASFGRLTVIEARQTPGRRIWACRCSCGSVIEATTGNLRSGQTKSCGCLHAETVKTAALQHGHNKKGGRTKEYRAWCHIIGRCHTPTDANFHNYGGRGVNVCERWRNSFTDFLADMGKAPAGTSIERNNNDGGYEPSNCRWATPYEQSRNTRRTVRVNGECLIDACAAASISYGAAQARIRRGQSPEAAVSSLLAKRAALASAPQPHKDQI